MARKVDMLERSVKLNEMLDCAQSLIYTIGYEEMSIQNIISELGISKGAFYHYFDSKPALLEALLYRTSQQGLKVIAPIADDPNIPPLEKLEQIINSSIQWKSSQKPYLMGILKVWYSDNNAIVRQKTLTEFTDIFGGLMSKVFKQGIDSGVFHTPFPEMVGGIVFIMMTHMSDSLGRILLKANTDPPLDSADAYHQMEKVIHAHTDAIEKVLGAAPGSIRLIDPATLIEWLPGELGNAKN